MNHIKAEERKVHPKEKANIISDLLFAYTLKLYRKGFKRDLQESDLYEVLSDYRSQKLGDQLELEWEKQRKRRKNLSIIRLLWKCYGLYYLYLGVIQLAFKSAVILIHPHALGKLVSYFVKDQTELSKHDVYFYAILVIGLNFVQCVYNHNYYLTITAFGIKVRQAFCAFLYRKALKLSPAQLGTISVGKVVTLMTKDVHAFETFIDFGNDIWIALVKTVIICTILYMKVGSAALVGVGFFFIVMPLQIYCGSLAKKMKMKMCKKTDERLQITQEVLSAIRIIKMYTWENFFDNKVSATRKQEVVTTYRIFFLRSAVLIIGNLNTHVAFYLLLMSYIWMGNHVTAETVYYIMACFHALQHDLSVLFPLGIYQSAELIAAIKRIGNVVKSMEIPTEEPQEGIAISPKIVIKNLSVKLGDDQVILNRISLRIEKGLTFITGTVGSGKSFLLKTILQDYKPAEGTLHVEGRLSYASQEPWLFPSSIRQNILFGEKYDERRYQEVLNVCALSYDFDLLPDGDNTIVEDRGINLSKGQQSRINLARAVYKQGEIYLLDDCLSALDAHVSDFIFRECIKKFLGDKVVVLVTHNTNHLRDADYIVVMDHGMIKSTLRSSELDSDDILKDTLIIEDKKDKEDLGDEQEDDQEESRLIAEVGTQKKVYQETKKSGKVEQAVYAKYLRFGGGIFVFACVISLYAVAQFVMSYTDKLISNWVNLEQSISNYTVRNLTNTTEFDDLSDKRQRIFLMYTIMTISTAVTLLSRSFAMLLFARKASIKLHKNMITTIINASMKFFDSNFIGNVLNRFSKDLTTVDEMVPFACHQVFRVFFILVGIVTLIATVNTIFLVPTAVFFAILVFLRRCCLRTSRSLKRLDAATRSPVVGHLNATLEGLTTIRAFKAQSILIHEFDRHQDLYTSASYTLMNSMRAFAFSMDMLCGVYIAIIVVRFVFFGDHDSLPPGNVGLAISQAFMLTGTLQWGIRQWAEIENHMTSVERVLEYTEVTKENRQGLVLDKWPTAGQVKYDQVNLSYTNSDEYVLKRINFVAEPRQKIGIVGRTGAGKSSIISTLFRLYEVEGLITIDGIDTRTLSLQFLRSHISIIPQDPVLFAGTIRDNVDPTRQFDDEQIWKAIRTANLSKLIPSLDFEINENGSNFSVGQRQLICLARAVARNNRIIVLDEATANMDPDTDRLIHETINRNFADCTVFTIAHKLQSILNCDKIIVMDKGEIIEMDSPENLLNREGVFYRMVQKAGLLSHTYQK